MWIQVSESISLDDSRCAMSAYMQSKKKYTYK